MMWCVSNDGGAVMCCFQCSKPVIAAVHGACIGAGVDLVCACDIRYCTDDAWFQVKVTSTLLHDLLLSSILIVHIIRDNRKSRQHGNHGNRDFHRMLWFCQNAMFLAKMLWFCVFYKNVLFLIIIHEVYHMILTQEYSVLPLLPKSLCFVIF